MAKMMLKRKYVDINNVLFDDRTYIEEAVLHVSKDELKEIVSDYRFDNVDFELAFPGEKTRLSMVVDCVQPMFKPEKDAVSFPGVVDEIKCVGNGETIVLRGVSVTETSMEHLAITSVLDMSGIGAEQSLILPSLIHICIVAEPATGVTKDDYFAALSVASKKVAKFLARVAKDCVPNEEETFELTGEKLEGLPKVAYVFQIFSHAPLTDAVYYGDGCAKMMPLIVQPTEILDGALVNRDFYQPSNADPTYGYQNHPIIIELMKRHGKDLNFVGVILSNTPHEINDKQRNAMMCASLAKYSLDADCVLITKEGGGHPQIDCELVCDRCEELGMKTAMLLSEFLSKGNPIEELVIFSSANADALVSSGCEFMMTFPEMERVVGMQKMYNRAKTEIIDVCSSYDCDSRLIRHAASQIGFTNLTTVIY